MQIKELQYFHQLTINQNFSTVAAHFSVSQPTISMAIKRLENELGTKLIHHDYRNHQLIINQTGQQLDQHVQTILNELTVAKREIRRAKQEQILFGLPPIIGNYYFPKIAPRLMKAQLLSAFKTVEAGSEQLLKMLLNGELDLALLGTLSPVSDPHITTMPLGQAPIRLIASSQYTSNSKLSIADLKRQPWVMTTADFIHHQVLAELGQFGHFRPHVIYRTPDIHVLKAMVQEQVGISLLTTMAINPDDHLQLLKVPEWSAPTFYLSLAKRTNQQLTPNQAAVWKLFAQSH